MAKKQLAVVTEDNVDQWLERVRQGSNPDKEHFDQLLIRANHGDKTVLPELRLVLNSSPKFLGHMTALALCADSSLIDASYHKNDLLAREVIPRTMDKMRAEIEGPNASPLVKLLAERIVACWLQVQMADASYAQQLARGLSAEQAEFLPRQQDRCHRRYVHAITALATVRRLLVPNVQINVGEQQLNVVR